MPKNPSRAAICVSVLLLPLLAVSRSDSPAESAPRPRLRGQVSPREPADKASATETKATAPPTPNVPPAPTPTVAAPPWLDGDREVLATLNGAAGGENRLGGKSMRQWNGVATNSHGWVTRLLLPDNGPTGELPAALAGLGDLQQLNLGDNRQSGELPSRLGNLCNLALPDLSGNGVTGRPPPEWGNLVNLQGLVLDGKQPSGCMPYELAVASENSFSGTPPSVCASQAPPPPVPPGIEEP